MKKNLETIKEYIIAILLVVIIIIIIATFCIKKISKKEEVVESLPIIEENIEEETNDTKDIIVEIKGAIENPGVYKLEENKRVEDVIQLAGGLKENANTNFINKSKILTDEMVIIIYTNEEIEEYKTSKEVIKYVTVEIPCTCPDNTNDACIENFNDSNQSSNKLISINKATLEELTTLPGIGESKAQNIIKYREEIGEFKDINDLENVTGIGTSIIEKIKDYITI